MLYKNDEPYKLMPNDTKVLFDKFKKFPLTIIYPPERVVKSRSKENTTPDKPNSMSFPLSATVKSIKGTEHWRYAENVIIKEHGVRKYTPKNFHFNGQFSFEEKDVELAWFLYTKSSYGKGCLNYNGKTAKFMFEDKISEAERKADVESEKTRFKNMIYGGELGLSEERLRAVAKAYNIRNVDNLSYSQVKLAVEHTVERDTKGGMKKFIEMTHMDDFIKTRSRLQVLLDSAKLRYDIPKKEWQWIEDGKRVEGICKVPPGANPNDVLYDHFMGNRSFQETVELVEKARKVTVEE